MEIFSQNDENEEQMNILFICVDDLRPELNCYGENQMKTPYIDDLAKNGIVFQRAYCQQAICMASRASILTGIRPEYEKLYNCRSLEELVPGIVTLNEHFSLNGYKTMAIGKVYHHREDHLAQFGDNWHDPTKEWEGRGYLSDEAIFEMQSNGKFSKGKNSKGPAYEMLDVPDNHYIDGANTDYAIEKLKDLKQQPEPFFMAIGYHKPHLPWCAPKKYWEMYPVEELSLSPAPEFPENITPYSLTNWGELRGYFGIPQDKDQISDELAIQLRRAYFASVSYMDAQVGRLLKALETNGLTDNTIIVLWGDHGWKLGDHHAWSKHTNYEIDTRVPLIISVPGSKNSGRATYAFAELVDIYPTLCDLTGMNKPSHLQGQSLVPIINDPDNQVKDAAYSIFPRDRTIDDKTITGFSMRTNQFRYTEWIHLVSGRMMAMELYDHQKDPLENINVVDKNEYSDIVKELSAKLHKKFDDAIPGSTNYP